MYSPKTDRYLVRRWTSPTLPGNGCLSGRRRPLSPLVVDIEADRAEQHQSLDHLLVVDADAEDRHAVVHDPHDHGPDHRAANLADAAIGRGAANEAGGDD